MYTATKIRFHVFNMTTDGPDLFILIPDMFILTPDLFILTPDLLT